MILGASLDPLYFDAAAVVLTLLTFGGLLVLLRIFVWTPVLTSVETRENRIEDAIRQAEQDRKTAEGVLADYKERVKNVENEVAALREKGRAEAESMRKEILAKADSEAVERSERAVREIELARTQALEDIRREAVTLGMAVATKVVGRSLDGEDHRRLASDVVDGLGSVGSSASDGLIGQS